MSDNWNKRIGLGTATFIPLYGIRHEARNEEPQKVLEQALSEGVNYFDTAPSYHNAEEALGSLLKKKKGIQVITKILFGDLQDEKKALLSIEKSIERLNGNIDGVLMHSVNTERMKNKLAVKTIQKIQKKFKIKVIGASTYTVQDALYANSCGWCQMIQFEGSVLNHSVLDALSHVEKNEVQWICRSILTQGLLAGVPPKYPHPRLSKNLKNFFEYSIEWNLSPVALAMLYVLGHPFVDRIVMGAANLNEWKIIHEANSQKTLTPKQMDQLKKLDLSELDEVHPEKWII